MIEDALLELSDIALGFHEKDGRRLKRMFMRRPTDQEELEEAREANPNVSDDEALAIERGEI